MLLKDKVALIFGTGGIAGGVARGFAAEGARLFLSNRHLKKARALADEVQGEAAELDATDAKAVAAYVDGVAKKAGRIDIAFNLIGVGDVQKPLMEISQDAFLKPIEIAMRTQFATTRAVAKHMIKRKSGVILAFGGGGPQTEPGLGGFKVALDAIEGLRRQWAIELGPHGIRIVTIKTGGVGDTLPEDMPGRDELLEHLAEPSPMKKVATLDDVGAVAAFLASDKARSITDTWVNIAYGGMPE